MNIIDDHKLLFLQQKNCLEKNSTLPFKFGGFTSIDDILTKLNVNVIIEPGVKTRNQLPSWENMKQSFDKINNHWKNEIDRLDGRRRDDISIEEFRDLQNIFENHRNEMVELANLPLRGLYNPKDNNITLFPDEMKQEYGGAQMEELLVSTLAHETMHAYFNRPNHDSYPYVYFVEEPLAEFGMLLYIHETEHYRNVANQYLLGKNQSDFYQWAYDDVKSKKTCYCYGSTLIDQCLKEGLLSPICAFLVSYKIQIDEYSALYPIKGEIKIPSQSITKSTSVTINGQIVNVRWRDISNLLFGFPNNLPTYFWDDNTHTLGLNGDWTSNNYYDLEKFYCKWKKMIDSYEFKSSRLFETLDNDIEWNLYLGDCFNIDNHIIGLFDLELYGHNSVIVDRLNPFCKIDKNGMARYNDGSLLPIYSECGKDFYTIRKCGKWGIVKETGEVVVSCKYDYIDFYEDNGLCKVGNSDDNGFHYGFVNEQGIEQIPVIYEDWRCYYSDPFHFENGVAVAKKDGRYGIINENNIIIHPFDMNYSSMSKICNGYATMEDSNGKWGAIDAKGKIVIPCQYDRWFSFNEKGIAEVEKDGKEFKIDTNGNSI